jgi:hypothetical protein
MATLEKSTTPQPWGRRARRSEKALEYAVKNAVIFPSSSPTMDSDETQLKMLENKINLNANFVNLSKILALSFIIYTAIEIACNQPSQPACVNPVVYEGSIKQYITDFYYKITTSTQSCEEQVELYKREASAFLEKIKGLIGVSIGFALPYIIFYLQKLETSCTILGGKRSGYKRSGYKRSGHSKRSGYKHSGHSKRSGYKHSGHKHSGHSKRSGHKHKSKSKQTKRK